MNLWRILLNIFFMNNDFSLWVSSWNCKIVGWELISSFIQSTFFQLFFAVCIASSSVRPRYGSSYSWMAFFSRNLKKSKSLSTFLSWLKWEVFPRGEMATIAQKILVYSSAFVKPFYRKCAQYLNKFKKHKVVEKEEEISVYSEKSCESTGEETSPIKMK